MADISVEAEKLLAQAEWEKLDAYDRAVSALRGCKYRISLNSGVALATAVDVMVHDIGLHALLKTIEESRVNIVTENMLKGIENTQYYSLFAQLPSFKAIRARIATGGPVPESVTGDTDEEDDIKSEASAVITTERKKPRHMNSFTHYINIIIRQHIAKKDNNKLAYRVSDQLKRDIDSLIKDFISNRMTRYLKSFLEVKGTKTVNEQQVIAALTLMLSDGDVVVNTSSLVDRIHLSLNRMRVFNKEYKDKPKEFKDELDPTAYIAVQDTVYIPSTECTADQKPATLRKTKAKRDITEEMTTTVKVARKAKTPPAVEVQPDVTTEVQATTTLASPVDAQVPVKPAKVPRVAKVTSKSS
jgi:hypothetical protein